jgi:hypothetical protein
MQSIEHMYLADFSNAGLLFPVFHATGGDPYGLGAALTLSSESLRAKQA